MCWQTFEKKNAEVKTANKDIPVFKVINVCTEYGVKPPEQETRADSGVPYFRGVNGMYEEDKFKSDASYIPLDVYKAGRTYSASGFDTPEKQSGSFKLLEIRKGFHSYSSKCAVRMDERYAHVLHRGSTDVTESIGAYCRPYDIPSAGFYRAPGIMDCVIPKGARYCVNEYGEYVSDKLRVTGFRTVGEAAHE